MGFFVQHLCNIYVNKVEPELTDSGQNINDGKLPKIHKLIMPHKNKHILAMMICWLALIFSILLCFRKFCGIWNMNIQYSSEN